MRHYRGVTLLLQRLLAVAVLLCGTVTMAEGESSDSNTAPLYLNGSWTTDALSEARQYLVATSVGNLALFAGGSRGGVVSAAVDIYNATDGSWTTATLSAPRTSLAATSVGHLALFAGGWDGGGVSAAVDIYNATDGSWKTAALSEARQYLAATSVGNLALFAGGSRGCCVMSAAVDIYNATDGSWTTANLSEARWGLAATSVANLALFAGGGSSRTARSAMVDIYSVTDGSWTTATLSQARIQPVATSLGDVALFAAGGSNDPEVGMVPHYPSVVDIYNATDGSWTTATLSEPRVDLAATSVGGHVALFAGGDDFDGNEQTSTVDIYNAADGSWTTANLSQARTGLAATSVGDVAIFAAGGDPYYTFTNAYSTVVDMYRLPISSKITSAIGVPVLWFSGFGANLLLVPKDDQAVLRPEQALGVNFGTTITEVDADGLVVASSSLEPNRGFVAVEPEPTGVDAAESFLFSAGLRSSNDTDGPYGPDGTLQVQFYLFRNRTDIPLGGDVSLPVDPSFAKFTVRISDWSSWRGESNSSLVLRIKVMPPVTAFTRRANSPVPGVTTFALGGQFSTNSRAGTEIRLANVVEMDGEVVTDAVQFDLDLATSELVVAFSRRFNSTVVYDPDLRVLFGQAKCADDEGPLATIIGASVAGAVVLVLVALVIISALAVAWVRRKRVRSASTRTQVNFDYDDENNTRSRKTSRAPPVVMDTFLMGDPL